MNLHTKPPAASVALNTPPFPGATADCPQHAADGGAAASLSDIGAHQPHRVHANKQTEGAAASNALNSATLCPQCGREAHRCMCPWPGDEDMMPAADVNRIMADWKANREARERYEAGEPEHGWALAEKSAWGMAK